MSTTPPRERDSTPTPLADAHAWPFLERPQYPPVGVEVSLKVTFVTLYWFPGVIYYKLLLLVKIIFHTKWVFIMPHAFDLSKSLRGQMIFKTWNTDSVLSSENSQQHRIKLRCQVYSKHPTSGVILVDSVGWAGPKEACCIQVSNSLRLAHTG